MAGDSISLQDYTQIKNKVSSEIDEAPISNRVCLNCGTELTDKFCAHCGQSAGVPAKMTNKTFGKSIAMTFTRMNSGFGNTLVKLMYKPWEVIRDYIHGRQVNYSHPVTMLIQVSLYCAFILLFLEGLFDVSLDISTEREYSNWFIKILKESTVLRVLWGCVPVILAAYLAFWNHGSRRFSFSEYVIAAIYLVICVRLYAFIFTPLNYLLFNLDKYSGYNLILIICVGILFGFLTMFKAFPIKSKWKAVAVFIWFLILSFLFYLIYSSIFEFLEYWISGNDPSEWFNLKFGD